MKNLVFLLLFIGCGTGEYPVFDIQANMKDSLVSVTVVNTFDSLTLDDANQMLFSIAQNQDDPDKAKLAVEAFEEFTGFSYRQTVAGVKLSEYNGIYAMGKDSLTIDNGRATVGDHEYSMGLLGENIMTLGDTSQTYIFKRHEDGIWYGPDKDELLTLKKLN